MQLRQVVFALVLIFIASPLLGFSLATMPPIEDPNSSENTLKNREFNYPLNADQKAISDNLEISLITFGKGEPVYVWFGHTALVVTDKTSGRSVMYDFGIFSFDDDFYQTFAMGKLNYEIWATSTSSRIELAFEENRDISSLKLNLSPSAKLEILNALNFSVSEPNNIYLYHHYWQNCSTRIRDIIDKGLDGQLYKYSSSIALDKTLRDLVNQRTSFSPYISWLLNFLQSGVIDKPITYWDAMFLPSILEEAVIEYSNSNDNKFVSERVVIHDSLQVVKSKTIYYVAIVSLVVALFSFLLTYLNSKKSLGIITITYKVINFSWSFASGILSLLLLFMMVATNHDVTYLNENIIFVSPILLVAAFSLLFKGLKSFRKINTILLIILIVYLILKVIFSSFFYQSNYQIIFTFLPLYLFNSSIFLRKTI